MTMLFLDTEFTAFRNGRLLALGLVAEDGREFYVELDQSPAQVSALNEFVRTEVVAQFGLVPGASVDNLEEAGVRLAEFLEPMAGTAEAPFQVACDYKLDGYFFVEALRAARRWTPLMHRLHVVDIAQACSTPAARMALMKRFSQATGPLRRHHALLDAQALRSAWQAREQSVDLELARVWLFQLGETVDHAKRTQASILAYDDEELEDTHDFIQWLFPLTEPSPHNPWAPVLDSAQFAQLAADRLVREGVLRSWHRMLRFYGLQATSTGTVVKAANWPQRAENWVAFPTHNDLRITRILQSLVLFGLRAQAQAMLEACSTLVQAARGDHFSAKPLQFWQAAVR